MAITPLYTTFELADGTTVGPIRVLAVDKIAAEKTARAQTWPYEDTPQIHALLTYWAAVRTNSTPHRTLDEFMADLADFALSRTLDDDSDDQADPTAAGSVSS